jgi:hypothetical protein
MSATSPELIRLVAEMRRAQIAFVAAKLRGVELSYAGKRGEIKRLAVEQGCFSDQALAMVLTDVERLAKASA